MINLETMAKEDLVLAEKATEGPWTAKTYTVEFDTLDIAKFDDPCDAKLSAQYRAILPALARGYLDLLAENEALNNPSDGRCMEIGNLRQAVAKLTQQLSEAKEVIEFYGDTDNWAQGYGSSSKNSFRINNDCGDVGLKYQGDEKNIYAVGGRQARAYLAKHKGDV